MMSAENENKCITIYNIIVNSLLSLSYLCDIRKLYTAQNISIQLKALKWNTFLTFKIICCLSDTTLKSTPFDYRLEHERETAISIIQDNIL